jgi:hypothetical protein
VCSSIVQDAADFLLSNNPSCSSSQKTLRILPDRNALEPLYYAVQWRRDDARVLIAAMRDIVKEVIEFPAPRCLV